MSVPIKKTKMISTLLIVTFSSCVFVFFGTFFANSRLQKEIANLTISSFLRENELINFKSILKKNEGFVVHFFATWCPHCILDHDILLENNEYNNIYAIAYLDTQKTLMPWLKIKGNPYDDIGLDSNGVVTKYLGIGTVPATIIFNNSGKIVKLYKGSLNNKKYKKDLKKYLTLK